MLESFRKNKKGILLMLFSSVCACVGQLLWKLAAERGELFSLDLSVVSGVKIKGPGYIIAGFAVYALGAVIMVLAYRYGKLSVLQPVLSMSYVLSIFLAGAVLHESVTLLKCIGIAVIIAGVVLVAGGDEE